MGRSLLVKHPSASVLVIVAIILASVLAWQLAWRGLGGLSLPAGFPKFTSRFAPQITSTAAENEIMYKGPSRTFLKRKSTRNLAGLTWLS